jgi:hypothetical protein
MRFGTWKVRSLYRVGSLKTIARELRKYKLDLGGQMGGGGTERGRGLYVLL